MSEHSPLPWKRLAFETDGPGLIRDAFSREIVHVLPAQLVGAQEIDAAFIVKAVNNHDKLIEALTKLVSDLDYLIGESYGVTGLHQNGETAPWGDLTRGGRFEEWLMALDDARDTLAALKEDAK